ncbi:uncharacterized protein LOC131258127 isoform X2 [Magnolia sinica]|nr:uncharacterized protein LOC131258127 isoform X2 [Magnolia sinica]XP_058115207.1 uncharacterized protein LOC131258127 isoform X2 [Magnolia sinica]
MDTDPLPSEKCDGDGPKARPGPCNYMMEDSICENANESRDKIASDSIPTSDGDGHKASPGTQDYMDMEDSILGTTNESGDKNASYSNSSGEVGLSEKDADLYTDKTVTEIELSELMVYSKDNVVKDICIDDGIPTMDKVLVENDEVGQKRVGFLQSELAENVDMTEEMEDSGGPVADGSKSLVFKGQLISSEYEEVAAKSSTASLREEGGQNVGATEEIVNATTDVRTPSEESLLVTEEVVNEELLLVQEPRMGTLQDESSSCARNEDQQPYDQGHALNSNESMDVRSQDATQEATLASHSCSEAFSNSSNLIDLATDSKVESGSIAMNSDPLPAEMIRSRDENKENAECQHSGRRLTASVLDDGALDSLTGSTRSFFIQHGLGESSFSATDLVSGPIAYSGAMPCSGSISFRSDSSTTSTRSFAFPILHSEWNSSPVKMAKADRRHLRKHRGWKVALCCRF